MIALHENSLTIKQELLKQLVQNKSLWDCGWINFCSGWGPQMASTLGAFKQTKELHTKQRSRVFAALILPTSVAALKESLSKNLRSNLKKIENRFKKCDSVEFFHCSKIEDIENHLEQLFQLHNLRWRAQGAQGSFERRPELVAFYKLFVPIALQQQWLRLAGIKVNGEIKAMQIGYAYNSVYFAIQEGFDPDSIEGMGNMLRWHTLETAVKEGMVEYDFLAEFYEHKRRWGAQPRTGYELFFWNNKIKNIFFYFMEIWPSGRWFTEVKSNSPI
jgi:CelD/BcsL family acetyltransferase involved in cellulose biosynthesis